MQGLLLNVCAPAHVALPAGLLSGLVSMCSSQLPTDVIGHAPSLLGYFASKIMSRHEAMLESSGDCALQSAAMGSVLDALPAVAKRLRECRRHQPAS